MANSDSNMRFFVRIRGKVHGPYSVKQLSALRSQGRFGETDEVSLDGNTWEPGSTLEQLFTSLQKPSQSKSREMNAEPVSVPAASTPKTSTPAPRDASAVWHYSVNDEQLGPVSLSELRQMLDLGRLTLRDLVWRQGMSEWCTASDIKELNPVPAELAELADIVDNDEPKRRTKSKSIKKVSADDEAETNEPLAPHFFDQFLSLLREGISENFLASEGQGAVELGRWAIYLSILVNLAIALYAAIGLKSPEIALGGIGFVAVALMLQYSAIKSCGAISQLLRAKTLRMSSTAFFDSLVIMLLIGGIVALVEFSIYAYQFKQTPMYIVGFGLFILCEYLALILLHPQAIGITISPRASTGEEAIAILTFFMMLPLRFVAAVFAFGSVISTIGSIAALVMLLFANTKSEDDIAGAGGIAAGSMASLLVCAAFPFGMYVYFVFAYLIVDVVRSILVIPDKLDQLSRTSLSNSDRAVE